MRKGRESRSPKKPRNKPTEKQRPIKRSKMPKRLIKGSKVSLTPKLRVKV